MSYRFSTGGSIPGLLAQLPAEQLNVTGSTPASTGHMYEKLNLLDIDAAGFGGEYTVQVCSFASLISINTYLFFIHRLVLDGQTVLYSGSLPITAKSSLNRNVHPSSRTLPCQLHLCFTPTKKSNAQWVFTIKMIVTP